MKKNNKISFYLLIMLIILLIIFIYSLINIISWYKDSKITKINQNKILKKLK